MTQVFSTVIAILTILITTTACVDKGLINLQSGNFLAQTTWQSTDSVITVPFVWHDGHIIINLSVNGHDNLKFAFDSGASATVLFESPRTQSMRLNAFSDITIQTRKIDIVNDAKVQLKAIELSKLTILHVPIEQSPLFADADQAYFDGAIGYDLLNRYKVRINYQAQTMNFYKKELIDVDPSQWQRLPLKITGGIPYVTASLAGMNGQLNAYKFVIDTGAPDYIYINSDLAKGFSFPTNYYEMPAKNFEGESTIKTSRVKRFQFAETEFNQLSAHDMPHFTDDIGVGLIGSRLLRNFDVIFDYQNKQVLVQKNAQMTTGSLIDRSGIQLEPHRQGGVVISVSPDSDAYKKGLRTGDIITEIAGKTIVDTNFDQLRDKLSETTNALLICWRRFEKRPCSTIKLADRI